MIELAHKLLNDIRDVIVHTRSTVYNAINSAMVQSYWEIGRLIVEEEQNGQTRAQYGKQLLKQLSVQLTEEFGKGFDASNLRNMRSFYLSFPKCDALSHTLSWTHYRLLIRIENTQAREWYMQTAIEHHWSARGLERQIGVLYYERLLSSKDTVPVMAEAKEQTALLSQNPKEYLRDPYVLDFLNLPSNHVLERERDLVQTQLNYKSTQKETL